MAANSRLRLTGSCGEEVGLHFAAYVRVGTGLAILGRRSMGQFLNAAGTRTFVLSIDPTRLQGLTAAAIHVHATGADDEHYGTVATAATVLR